MKLDRWPQGDVMRLLEMKKLGWRLPAIAAALNRTVFSIEAKFRYLKITNDQRETRNRGIRRRRRGKGSPLAPINRVSEICRPHQSAMDERDRRCTLQPLTLTAFLCGDPLPGMSALDRRGARS